MRRERRGPLQQVTKGYSMPTTHTAAERPSLPQPPVVLLTGASTGLGRATAELLVKHNFRVFGTSRNARTDPTLPFPMLPLDVCSDESVAACVQAVLTQAGRIDVLINNAGHALNGALEETTLAQAEALFATNFFGAARMINHVLPLLRQQRSGTILNVSSLFGLVAMPFEGFYVASKHALEGYTETLRLELTPFNIRVAMVEPSGIRTAFARSLTQAAQPIADYAALRRYAFAYFVGAVETGADPRRVAQTILHILQARAPRLRHPVGADTLLMYFGKRLLPAALTEAFNRWLFRLEPHPPAAATTFALLRLLGIGNTRH